MQAAGMKITNFHYANTTFQAPAGFVEYPKWVHRKGHPSQIAEDAEAEAKIIASWAEESPKVESPVAAKEAPPKEPSERDALIQIAAEKNIKIDKRWSDKKLKAAIAEATAHL